MEPSSLRTMDTNDWRTQLPSDLRRETFNKIFERVKEQLPFSGAIGTEMVKKFATEFEESVFTNAANQDDYIRQTTLKPLNIETGSQNADGSSSQSNNINMQPPLDLGNDNTNLPNEEPPAYDWRAQYPQDSRLKNIDRTMKILMNREPYALGQGEINELMKIAINFEQSSFYNAINQEDYQEKLSNYIEAYNKL